MQFFAFLKKGRSYFCSAALSSCILGSTLAQTTILRSEPLLKPKQSYQVQPIMNPDQITSLAQTAKDAAPWTWWIHFQNIDPKQESARPVADLRADQPGPDWHAITVPGPITKVPGYRSGQAVVYYRKAFYLPAGFQSPLALQLGIIDDRDIAWLNGCRIGFSGQWDGLVAQAYDRRRIYVPEPECLRKDQVNVLVIQVRGSARDSIGLIKGKVQTGPIVQIYKEYLLPPMLEIALQAMYFIAGLYFLLFFMRRMRDRENLFFGLFAVEFAIYQFLRTQIKTELDFPLLIAKRVEYVLLFSGVPFLYYFFRYYFRTEFRWVKYWDRILWVVNAIIGISLGVVLFIDDPGLWWQVQAKIVQPTWLVFFCGIFIILFYHVGKKDRDAFYMLLGILALSAGVVLDTLTSHEVINLPPTLSYFFVVFLLGLAAILSNRFVRLHEVNAELSTNLEKKVQLRTRQLEESHDELRRARDALWSEMELARKLQEILIPPKPVLPGYEIACFIEPAAGVGGDYYDVIHVNGKSWIVIGDVSGHGVSAGLVMMMVQTSIHTVIQQNPAASTSDLLSIVNKVIYANVNLLGEALYVTITVLAVIDQQHFCFSGLHQDILIYRANEDRVEVRETDGMWLGLMADIRADLDIREIKLNTHDVVVLYTDGVTEARARDGSFYSDQKLLKLLAEFGRLGAPEIKEKLLHSLRNFDSDDDVTFLILKKIEL
ncbi:MAG: SpoIIE family protein phosphatase [Leptospiraceae bacterium]|nr:SpoIIE family protein phosphatase [Leptospiraceae bacterium]